MPAGPRTSRDARRGLHYRLTTRTLVAARRAAGMRASEAVNENFSLIVMCIFLLASLAFLAQQITAYH